MSQAGTNASNDSLPAGETSLAHYLDALASGCVHPRRRWRRGAGRGAGGSPC